MRLTFATLRLTVAILFIFIYMSITDADVLDVGSQKQLFIDELFFDSKDGVRLQINPAVKTGEQNLTRTKPWENATPNWFTVREDGGKYRMWYEAYDVTGWPTGDDTSFCYAESQDGINWDKPQLGLVEYQGDKKTNILFRQIGPDGASSRVHGTCVFIDPTAKPEERYKGVSQGSFSSMPGHTVSWGSGKIYVYVAGMTSPDGIHWKRLSKPIIDAFADSQYSGFWDPDLKKYLIYGRVGGKQAGRAIGMTSGKNFEKFEPFNLVLDGDAKLFPDCGLYNPAAMKYPFASNVYLMFPSMFNSVTHKLDIYLAVSRDGVKWSWPSANTPFIPLGKNGSFDSGSLYMGQGYIIKNDEIWQYYGGSRLNHAEGELENLVKPGNSRIFSRVVSRMDGYVSVTADKKNGWFVTPPIKYMGNMLLLNVKCKAGGSVRAALLDEKGKELPYRTLDDCMPVACDKTSVMVRWKSDGDVSQYQGKPVRLKFEINNAEIYSFKFEKGYPYTIK